MVPTGTRSTIGSGKTVGTVTFLLREDRLEPHIYEVTEELGRHYPEVGGVVTFTGRVRNHHNGREVTALEYSVYSELAQHEGERIVQAAVDRFGLIYAYAAHRFGPVPIGEIAVWVLAGSAHREEAFAASRWIIDEVKKTVPVWKHEWYGDGHDEWILGNP